MVRSRHSIPGKGGSIANYINIRYKPQTHTGCTPAVCLLTASHSGDGGRELATADSFRLTPSEGTGGDGGDDALHCAR